jgi:hypothetical protein
MCLEVKEVRAELDAPKRTYTPKERLVWKNWARSCKDMVPTDPTYTDYAGQTSLTADNGSGTTHRAEHAGGNEQLCDTFGNKVSERRGAETVAYSLFTFANVNTAAEAAGVPYHDALMLTECAAELLLQSSVRVGGTNVKNTGEVFGRVVERLVPRINIEVCCLMHELPELSWTAAKAIVDNRLPISHFADDYGIVVRAVGLGLGEDCSAGLLQRVLSSIGGKRPSPYPLSVELRCV